VRPKKRRIVKKAFRKCWFCEFHTHPFAVELNNAIIESSKRVTVGSIASMVCHLVEEGVASGDLVLDGTYDIDQAIVVQHISEHVVDVRVQLPHMIRSLQGVYSDLQKSLYVCPGGDEEEDECPEGQLVNKACVDAMVKVSSQISVLYRYEQTCAASKVV
jgi:hypothetical protein